ncbi:sensor histidine kinase [Fulvivirga sediminis]|uniref:histidine kinase n=1 Tax=Fulvivirga sediminis TaxID=2803949 RepID=A0A937F2K5_9BACT|nr:HAMP domain-containing sensor histidine kinase [Fulvivirga sediminis]MBL3654560.1 HAMP domain-containing histidine kinase [Fulvivirga sediminis]
MKNKLDQDLVEANDLLEHFILGCSSDLKSPLGSIKDLIHLAKLSQSDKNREQYLRWIDESTVRMDRLIQSMENYLINTKEPIKNEKVNFYEIIDAVVVPMTPLIKRKGINLSKRIMQKAILIGDKNRILLILKYLIDNAICYQKSGAKNNFLDIAIKVNKYEANIEICDNGEGISKDNIKNVFKMFFRSSKNSKGSGLGLYLVKEVLQKMNGSIKVVSSRGVGSNFIIKIPNSLNNFPEC